MYYLNLLAKTKKEQEQLFAKYLNYAKPSMTPYYILQPKLIGKKNNCLIFAKSYTTLSDEEIKSYSIVSDFSIKTIKYENENFIKQLYKNAWKGLMPFNKLWFTFMCKELNEISPDLKNQYVKDFEQEVRKYRQQQKYRIEEVYDNETEYIIDSLKRISELNNEK